MRGAAIASPHRFKLEDVAVFEIAAPKSLEEAQNEAPDRRFAAATVADEGQRLPGRPQS